MTITKMQSIVKWRNAPQPNYNSNINKNYPYSDMPFFQYHAVKIPISLNNLIDHVDYWGEGRVETQNRVTGFRNCYNVNLSYRLVSDGPDKDRKIPNRIPVKSHSECDTSIYITDSSVNIVTVMGKDLNDSTSTDIARIVNNDLGKVVVFDSNYDWRVVDKLTTLLQKKGLHYCAYYELPTELREVAQFNNHMIFISGKLLDEEFEKCINNGSYDNAVTLIKKSYNERSCEAIIDIVLKLLTSKSDGDNKIMSFVYTLWISGGQDIVKKYFPEIFILVVDQNYVQIVNYGCRQALILDDKLDYYKDRQAWGTNGDENLEKTSWKLVPVWSNNEVTFKLYNTDSEMFMKLDVNVDTIGDRMAWGSKKSDEDRHRYYIEPHMEKDGTLVFFIINYKYHQGLKLGVGMEVNGDRALWGHNGNIYDGTARYKWYFM